MVDETMIAIVLSVTLGLILVFVYFAIRHFLKTIPKRRRFAQKRSKFLS